MSNFIPRSVPSAVSSRSNRSAKRSAFTLVEVLVTMAFASILLPSVMQGVTLCLSTAGAARQEAQAAALAHSKLSELLATGQYQGGAMSGGFDDWPEFRWEGQLTNWDNVALSQLEVKVFWKTTGHEHSVTMTTLVYPYTTYAGNLPAYLGNGGLLSGGGLGATGAKP